MRKVIILAILSVIALAVLGVVLYRQTLTPVTFSLGTSIAKTIISPADDPDKHIKTIEKDKTILLKPGEYSYTTSGESLVDSSTLFTVSEEPSSLSPDFVLRESSRASLLEKEQEVMRDALAASIGDSLSQRFAMAGDTILGDGTWGSILLWEGESIEETEAYRATLHKKEGTWHIIRYPELILSASHYKDVPPSIVQRINELTLF